jgi:hypothetical protein
MNNHMFSSHITTVDDQSFRLFDLPPEVRCLRYGKFAASITRLTITRSEARLAEEIRPDPFGDPTGLQGGAHQNGGFHQFAPNVPSHTRISIADSGPKHWKNANPTCVVYRGCLCHQRISIIFWSSRAMLC